MKDILIIVLCVLFSLDHNTVCAPNEKASDPGKFFVLFSEMSVSNETVSARIVFFETDYLNNILNLL